MPTATRRRFVLRVRLFGMAQPGAERADMESAMAKIGRLQAAVRKETVGDRRHPVHPHFAFDVVS